MVMTLSSSARGKIAMMREGEREGLAWTLDPLGDVDLGVVVLAEARVHGGRARARHATASRAWTSHPLYIIVPIV